MTNTVAHPCHGLCRYSYPVRQVVHTVSRGLDSADETSVSTKSLPPFSTPSQSSTTFIALSTAATHLHSYRPRIRRILRLAASQSRLPSAPLRPGRPMSSMQPARLFPESVTASANVSVWSDGCFSSSPMLLYDFRPQRYSHSAGIACTGRSYIGMMKILVGLTNGGRAL